MSYGASAPLLEPDLRAVMVRLYNACGERPIETCEAALATGTAAKPREMPLRR